MKLTHEKTFVYNEDFSLTYNGLLSKFIWAGHIIYIPVYKNDLFIPANQDNWKWIFDKNNYNLTKAALKLTHDGNDSNFILVHYDLNAETKYPVEWFLTAPEFMGHFASFTIEDKGCRVKSLIHPIHEPLFIDSYKIKFIDLNKKILTIDVEVI